MTQQFDRHIDSDELDALVSSQATGVNSSGNLSEQTIREAQRHVESCQDCHRKVQMHKSVQSEISRRGAAAIVPPGSGCVDESEWVRVAAGLLSETETRELMKHAAQCGHCGPFLRNSAEVLLEDATPDEERLLAGLSSARPEWQSNLAESLKTARPRDLRALPTPWWSGLLLWPRPAVALAAAAVAIVVGWVGVRALRPPSAGQLLARAYTERRTIEVRIPDAKYAPLRVERGSDGSNLDKPTSLLRAEAMIGENLQRTPNDPVWLQDKARADLLDNHYDSAIKALQHAQEAQPDSSQLLSDLGAAYFVRASSTQQPIDYGYAIDLLGKALAKAPDDPVALFNRALACEHLFLYTQAVDDWEHYLRIDPQGEWSDEARRKLAAVRQKLHQHEKSESAPLLKPAEIAGSPADAMLPDKLDARAEQYLHIAITDWLPEAFPSSPSAKPANEAHRALATLAEILKERHGDSWLEELLSHSGESKSTAGIEALAAAVKANDRGDCSAAQNASRRAGQLFRSGANSAGEMRAEAEEVYSDHLLWEGDRCISLLRGMEEPLRHASYGWIRAQMSLEESNCANLVGDLGTYQASIGKGMREAEAHHYPALFLRGLGFQALSSASLGDASTDFSLVSSGLSAFWSGNVDLMKGYNLYYDLDAAADGLHLPNLQIVLWREATRLIDQHPDVLQRAMAHRWFGNAAYLANMPTLATAEFSKASALFAALPQTPATIRDRMDAEVWLANMEIRQGEVAAAGTRLRAIKPILDASPSFDPEVGYYSAQADIALRENDSAEAEAAVRSAVSLSEWALRSLPAERDRQRWAEQTRNAYRDAVEWKLRQGDAASALELWEWYKGAEFRAVHQTALSSGREATMRIPPDSRDAPPLPSPNVVASQWPLLQDETVIAYATFADGIAVWTYDDRGIFSQWISTPLPAVQERALRLQRLCSNPASDLGTLRSNAQELYRLLIAPIEERLVPGRTLVFEPDDMLAAVPWDVLVGPGMRYLVERAPVLVMPGLYRTMHLRPATAITERTPALVVSVPAAPSEGLTPLAEADGEAQTVAGGFRSVRWLEGGGATLSSIRSDIRGAVVFHFAGHSLASPMQSGLVLAEIDPRSQRSRMITADTFRSNEIAGLQLAVISACHTDARTPSGSSGTEGFADALLQAGIPHVVVSRWNVDSRETADFMKRFYAALLAGNGVANAMRTARLALAAQPASMHPYYWAAFQLEGKK